MATQTTILAYHDVKEIIDGEAYHLEVAATLLRGGRVLEATLHIKDYLELEHIKNKGYVIDTIIREAAE